MPRLVNVKLDLKLPGLGGIQGTWEPDESEVRAAWELYVGMVTRTPLGEFSSVEGSTRETLNSIYSLFDTTMAVLGGRMETPATALARAAVDLAIIGVMADGGLRRSEAAALAWGDVEFWLDGTARLKVQKGKNQADPATVALTETTTRALRDIQPDGADPAAPVFGLTGETLANRIRAAARAAGLGEDFSGNSGRIGMARRMVAAGAPTAAVQHQGRWKHGDMVARYTRGEAAGEALKWLT